jgi:lysophospholipase L1-like esterase
VSNEDKSHARRRGRTPVGSYTIAQRRRRRRRSAIWRRRGVLLAGLALLMLAGVVLVNPHSSAPARHARVSGSEVGVSRSGRRSRVSAGKPSVRAWRVAWGSPMAWAQPGVVASDTTVRELATVPLGGRAVRVRISNLFGDASLVVGAGTVALSSGGAGIVASTLKRLAFRGRRSITIPVGRVAYSDAVPLIVAGGQTLSVSVYVRGPDLVTLHRYGNLGPVSFFTGNGGGNQVDSVPGTAFPYSSEYPRWVDAVDVLERRGEGSIVVVGDSITDGYNSTLRWTDLLQKRIDRLPAAQRRAVINEGITANALSPSPGDDSKTGGGHAGLSRLQTDALGQPGVSYLVLFLGTNDLFFGDSAEQVISAMRSTIARAHRAGIKIIGVTLLPREDSERWDPLQYPDHQPYLEQIDHWILTSHAFDGVLDLAHAVADVYDGQCNPIAMFAPYDSGDHLHPNAAGQTAMANAVNTRLFDLHKAPRLHALVTVKPTPGCLG